MTRRNRAAVRAAETSASAAIGASAPDRRLPPASGAGPRAAAGRPRGSVRRARTTTSGTCTTKIACQENSSVSAPPRAGPSAAPTIPAAPQTRMPPAGPRCTMSSSSADATTAAPPIACAQRAAISASRLGASAQASEAAAKVRIPSRHAATAPPRRTIAAAGSAASASTRLNEVSTQATSATSARKSRRTAGRPSVTTDESARTIATAPATKPVRVRPRRSCAWPAGNPLTASIVADPPRHPQRNGASGRCTDIDAGRCPGPG